MEPNKKKQKLTSNKSIEITTSKSIHSQICMPSPRSPKVAKLLYTQCYQETAITHGIHRSPSVSRDLSSLSYIMDTIPTII
mmetsp:Transcript_65337/g.58624  ORF Transcript_65337/g.58624 Transcript_65337/m.58624 type:complete len:81 (-) Transcript_65337:95-337(-)